MTDYSGLVERLRDNDQRGWTDHDAAAAAIEAQRERIERLEGALQRCCDEGNDAIVKIAGAALKEKS